jgi:hypothetical protein
MLIIKKTICHPTASMEDRLELVSDGGVPISVSREFLKQALLTDLGVFCPEI